MLPADAVRVHNSLHVFSVAVLYYDHLLTLRPEVERIWSRPRSASALWFFLNRYLSGLGNIPVTVLNFWKLSPHGCDKFSQFREGMLAAAQVVACSILLVRTYALYNKSRGILAFLSAVVIILFGLSCWGVSLASGKESGGTFTASSCEASSSRSAAIDLSIAWIALFTFDTLIFGLTLHKTWSISVPRRASRRNSRRRSSLTETAGVGGCGLWWPDGWRAGLECLSICSGSEEGRPQRNIATIMMKDGALYFGVAALATLSNLFTFYFVDPLLQGALSTFCSCITATMISRLMLGLHESSRASPPSIGLGGALPSFGGVEEHTANSAVGGPIFTSRFDVAELPVALASFAAPDGWGGRDVEAWR